MSGWFGVCPLSRPAFKSGAGDHNLVALVSDSTALVVVDPISKMATEDQSTLKLDADTSSSEKISAPLLSKKST